MPTAMIGAMTDCIDCGSDTHQLAEYYMVHHDLWESAGATDGMLCIACLEERLDRNLAPGDFLRCPVNDNPRRRSHRLRSRLRGT